MIRIDSLPLDVQEAMCTPMHLILPPTTTAPGSLYLGSMVALYDSTALQERHITDVVQVLDALWYPYVESKDFESIYQIDILDQTSADLKPHLDMACDHIDRLLKEGKNVLVHCQQGISRSASVVIAYLIRNCGMTYDSAYAFVRHQRACVKPNEGFVKVLRQWEAIWHGPRLRAPHVMDVQRLC